MAKGIGMEILVYDVFDIPQNVLEEYSAVQTTMDQILKECDFITLHVPLTDETKI